MVRRILENVKSKKSFLALYFFIIVIYTVSNATLDDIINGTFKAELAFILAIFIVGFLAIIFGTKKLHKLAFFIIIFFGLLSVFVTPILDIPDEDTHFARAELTARGNFEPRAVEGYNFEISKSVSDLYKDTSKSALESEIANSNINFDIAYISHVAAAYPFFPYIVQAIGINIAKSLDLHVAWLMWMGRIGNVLLSGLICCLAIKISPKFKMHLFAIACFPMSIYLAASMSIDAAINCFSLFAIGYFVKMYCADKNSLGYKNIFIYFLICLVPGLSKLVYAALVCLLLFVPKDNFMIKPKNTTKFFSVFIMFVVCMIWYFRSLLIPAMPSPISGVSLLDQIEFILMNPMRFLKLLIDYIVVYGTQIFSGLFTFGWLTYPIPVLSSLYMFFYGALALMYPVDFNANKLLRIGVFLICLMIFVSIGIIMYLTWTSVGAESISGVQSRYFIPLLSLLPIVFSLNKSVEDEERLREKFVFIIILFVSCMLISTCLRYY